MENKHLWLTNTCDKSMTSKIIDIKLVMAMISPDSKQSFLFCRKNCLFRIKSLVIMLTTREIKINDTQCELKTTHVVQNGVQRFCKFKTSHNP